MKIVFFEVMPGEEALVRAQLPVGHEVVFLEDRLCLDTIEKAADAQIISVFVKSELPAAVIDQLPQLKLITTRSMGFDHIDVEHARSKGIHVSNVQTYASHPVAEFTFALLLAVSRKICPANEQLREKTDFDHRTLRGFNLFGKTIGIVGTGRIGKNVAILANGFGMKVLAYDPTPDQEFASQYRCVYAPLEHLVEQSDILTLHAPYTKENHHLFHAGLFAKMKKGTILINTARGELVDTHALVAAIKSGIIGGAGLDVLEGERDLKEELSVMASHKPGVDYELLAANHVLIDHPSIVVTPHIAYATTEAMEEIIHVTTATISNLLAGKEQKYL